MADETFEHRMTEEELISALREDREEEAALSAADLDLLMAQTLAMPPAPIREAVGALIIGQNALETALYILLFLYLALPTDVIAGVFGALSNRTRADLLLKLAEAGHHTLEEREGVAAAIRCFDICTENRNIVAHSGFYETKGERYIFRKYSTGLSSAGWQFAVTEEELSGAVTAMTATTRYVIGLWSVLHLRQMGATSEPLPERPPQPRKLSLYRLPADQIDDAPRP